MRGPAGRLALFGGAAALLVAAAVGLVAYVVIPRIVHRELHEAPPPAAAVESSPLPAISGSAGAPAPLLNPVRVAHGSLVRINAVDYGSGAVNILSAGDARFVLRFEGVDIAGAPDMYVYLSDHADGSPGAYTDLGRLKATTGSFNYDLPAGVDPSKVRSVVIWCRQFATTITFAPLSSG